MKKFILMMTAILFVVMFTSTREASAINNNFEIQELINLNSTNLFNNSIVDFKHDNLNEDYLRPKWVQKLIKILNTIEDVAAGIGEILEHLYPPIVNSGSNGYGVDFTINTDSEALSLMKGLDIIYTNGTINFKQDVLAFVNEEDGRTIFIKAGTYRVDRNNTSKLLLIAK